SGTVKSPAHQKVVAHLYRVQKRLLDAHKQSMTEYSERVGSYAEAKRKAKGGGGGDPGDPPREPGLGRVVVSDGAVAKVAEVLEDTPRGLLAARDELAAWLGSFTRYKGKAGTSDLPHWLEAFRAAPWLVDRKTGDRKHYFVHHAAVSVCGTIQPTVLAR